MNHKASRIFFCALLLVLFFLSTHAMAASGGGGGYLDAYCGYRCKRRCRKAGYAERCLKYCGICCRECKCVPSGTYGHKHECSCYNKKLNSKRQPKCP